MQNDASTDEATRPLDAALVRDLVANHRRFLAFLERRVGSRDTAEEILQAAFARTVEKSGDIRDKESSVAWFYRLLRNAVIDHHRRSAAQARALEVEAGERAILEEENRDAELERTICACFEDLLPTLTADYAAILRAVDLGGEPLGQAAARLGITANNASVRLHRARKALRRRLEQTCTTCAKHGCLDCTCGARRKP